MDMRLKIGRRRALAESVRLAATVSLTSLAVACGGGGNAPAAAGPGTSGPAAGKPSTSRLTIKLPHIAAEGQPHDLAAHKLGDVLKDKTRGEIDVQVFPNSQLGADPELFEQVQQGNINMAMVGDGSLAAKFPKFHWSLAPFVLKDEAHYARVLKSDLMKELDEEVRTVAGTRILAHWYRSARHFGHRSKAIGQPSDGDRVKLRVAQVPLYTDAYRDIGFAVTPMNWGELYNALRQGVVDGMEAQLEWFWGSKLFEVQKVLTLSQHCFGDYCVAANEQWWQSLGADQQQAIQEAAQAAGTFDEERVKEWDARLAGDLAAKGMQVVETKDVDRAAFAKIIQEKSIPRYEQAWGAGYYDRIMKLA